MVEPAVVVTLEAVNVVPAPKVTAPAYVWLPLVATVAPLNPMALAVTQTVVRFTVPTAPPKLTAEPVPTALIFKLLVEAVSPEMVLATAIKVPEPVLSSTVFLASVTSPV